MSGCSCRPAWLLTEPAHDRFAAPFRLCIVHHLYDESSRDSISELPRILPLDTPDKCW